MTRKSRSRLAVLLICLPLFTWLLTFGAFFRGFLLDFPSPDRSRDESSVTHARAAPWRMAAERLRITSVILSVICPMLFFVVINLPVTDSRPAMPANPRR